MIVYFANRKMEILGQASTNLPKGIVIKEDNKAEEIDVGVATFECRITYSDETRAVAEQWTEAGNYILRSNGDEKEFYTIINTEIDTKEQDIYIYAEDAGMDLLNEILKASDENSTEQTCTEYVEDAIYDSGFEIGINESDDSVKKLLEFDEQTASERILDIMKEFELEVSYSFNIDRLTVTNKYINIHKKRGKNTGVQLRDGRELDGITIKKTVENLATALLCTGSEDASGVKISLQDYEYDDGDFYVEGHYLKSRNALAKWSRYVNPNEPNTIDNVGHIVQTFTYDTVDQKELCEQAIKELKKKCDIERNYEIEITHLPEGIKIGDIVNVVDDAGELYLQSRLLKLETSIVDNTQTATLGDYLIRSSGISEKVEELASQFKNFADSQTYYTWIAYADDSFGNGISLDPDGKTWVGFAENQRVETPDISNPEIYKWSKFQGEPGIRAVSITNQYYLSSSDQEPKDGEWSDTPLEWIEGKYLWKRNKITWSDETVTYTDPELDAALNQANKNANDAANDANDAQGKVDEVRADVAVFKKTITDDLDATNANIENLKAKHSELEEAVIGKADIKDLTVASGRIDVLESDYSRINTLVNGNLTSENIQNLTLTSKNTTIENGMIKDAMIESMTFDKITGIDVNTTNLTIHSEDGKSQWSDNTIQISDANRVRVQIGKDASGDYSMSVWDADGKLIWDALGATENTIQRKIIRDNIVAEDAAISGSKLDITSVIKEVNDSTTKLKSSTISFDEKNQTLDVVLDQMQTTVDGINETTTTNATSINVMQGQISSLISEDENIKGDYNALVSRYNSTEETISSIKTTIGEHETILKDQDGEIQKVTSKTNEIETDLNGTKQTISSIQETADNANSKVAEFEKTIDGLTTRVSTTETNYTDAEKRITAVESKATQNANKFTWLVKSGTSSSNFEITDRLITLVSQEIKVDGLVKFMNTATGNGLKNIYDLEYADFESVSGDIYYSKHTAITSVSVDNSTSCHGSNSLKISYNGANLGSDTTPLYLGNASNNYGCVKIEKGKKYILSCYVKANVSVGVFEIDFCGHATPDTSTGLYLSGFAPNRLPGSSTIISLSGEWQRAICAFEVSSSATDLYISPVPLIWGKPTSGLPDTFNVWIDCIQLEEVDAISNQPSNFMIGQETVIDGGAIKANTVTADKISTDAIKSRNYVKDRTGSFLDLADGAFDSKYLKWDSDGKLTATNATIYGRIQGGDLGDEGVEYSLSNQGLIIQGVNNGCYLRPGSFELEFGQEQYLKSSDDGSSVECNANLCLAGSHLTWKDSPNNYLACSSYNNAYNTYYYSNGYHAFYVGRTGTNNTGTGMLWINENGLSVSGEYGLYSSAMSNYIARYYVAGSTKSTAIGNNSYATRIYGSSVWANKTISTSDERLKRDFKSLDNLDDVYMSLQPVSFKYLNGYDKEDDIYFGLKAQSTEKLFKSIGENPDNYAIFNQFGIDHKDIVDRIGYDVPFDMEHGLDYTNFIPWNMHMIQKTRKEMSYQVGRIDMHEAIITDLQIRLLQAEKTIKQLTQALA